MNLIQSLQNLDLNEKEARVYVAMLQLGKTTAHSIARHANLKRPTTYLILESLIDKSIVKKIPETNATQYVAIGPKELFSYIKNKIEITESEFLPELEALKHSQNKNSVRVSYYEGLDGIKEVSRQMFKIMSDKEMLSFASHREKVPLELIDYVDNEWYPKLKKVKGSRRFIHPSHQSLDKYTQKGFTKSHNIKIKTLPKDKYNSHISINIAGDYTQILSLRYLNSILIHNPDVAKTMRQIFNLIWSQTNCKS